LLLVAINLPPTTAIGMAKPGVSGRRAGIGLEADMVDNSSNPAVSAVLPRGAALSFDLTNGPVPAHLRRQATPMALGLIAIISFDVVDLFFVSRLGDAQLAAISFCFPVLWLLTSVIIGFEAGAASTVSRAVGKGDLLSARRLTTDTALLAGLATFVVCQLGLQTIDLVFPAMGATDDLMPLVHEYMDIWYWSVPASAISWICLASMRARGNTLLEGKIIVIAAIINLILDPIMIFGLFGFPRLEMAGAALATLCANTIVMVGTLSYLHFELRVLATPFTALRNILDSWKHVMHIGLPAMLTNTIVPISNAIIVAMIAGYGVDAVAGFGVAIRIEPIVLIAFYSLSAVTSPFMGQNFAAGKVERLDEARKVIGKFCIIAGLSLAALLVFLAGPVTALFSDTSSIQNVAIDYLWIMAISYGGYGMVMSTCAAFNGVGYPIPGVVISVMRALVLFLPLALLGQWQFGLNGIFIAAAACNILLGIVSYLWFGRNIRVHGARFEAARADESGVDQT
jgi:putative MATE family efflux protein